ncbi:MAG: hypothetical protein ACOC2N_04000 [Spirochaetota bacterium]
MTIGELYELFDRLRPYRSRAAASILDNHLDTDESRACMTHAPCRGALTELTAALEILESLPGEGFQRELSVDGRDLSLTLDYEFRELRRDVVCLEEGMRGVARSLRVPGAFQEELSALQSLLATGRSSADRYAAIFTDRDGTIANYCGRYRSSHQPLYAAVRIGRFARMCTDHFFVVTSGPLYGHGLLSLSAFPEATVHLAGSKGREYVLADGSAGSFPLTDEQRSVIIALDERIQALLERPEYRVLTMIGSGYQRKFGQLTVSRQDIHRSVPAEVSDGFLREVRRIVSELDGRQEWFDLDDTGFDIEVTLVAEGGRKRGFHKGDGVAFLVKSLDLDLHRAPVLVCGDTASDVPMLEYLAEAGCETHAIFVATDGDLERRVRRVATRSAFCSGPDVLVAALGISGRQEERNEYGT